MRTRLSLILAIASVLSLLVLSAPASADPPDIIPTDTGSCNTSISISPRPITPDVYTMKATGSGNCPGSPDTVEVCVLQQQANGDYVEAACGSGGGTNGASASAEVVCVTGTNYKGRVIAESGGGTIAQRKTSPVTCPPLTV